MPSTRISDCATALANAWLTIESTYRQSKPGFALMLTCTYRSGEEQFALYQQGRQQASDGNWQVEDRRKIVTNCDGYRRLSKHNRFPAEALDFAVLLPGGKITWHEAEYEVVGLIAEAKGLVWGGRFTTPPLNADPPHLELREGKK